MPHALALPSSHLGQVWLALQCAAGLASRRAYYGLLLWGWLAHSAFLVRTMRSVAAAAAEAAQRTHYGGARRNRNALALSLALAQAPIALWLGHLPDRGGAA